MADRNEQDGRHQGGEDRPSQEGPRRQEMIDEQALHRSLDSLGASASYQSQPEVETPDRARVTATGTAARSEAAAGLEGEPYHHDDAERAFRQNRGDRRPRKD